MIEDFRREVLKIDQPRKHSVNKSLGVYDAYKYIRKNKWFDIGRPLTEHEFYTIIRQINNLLADNLLHGKDVDFPNRMGTLELRKYEKRITFDGNTVHTNLPIDWDRTLKLWAEDSESYRDKVLIRVEEDEIFKVFYNRGTANYNNKSFYEFDVNRDLKRRLKQRIKDKLIDAFIL